MIRRRWSAALVVALMAAAGHTSPVSAQQFQGVALGPEGEPLPGVSVALHRVGEGGGSTAATTTTDGEGRFTFDSAVQDSALYFAAIRYQDRMYIGPAIRGAGEATGVYEVRAVPEAEAGRVASMLAGGGRTAGPLPSSVTDGAPSAGDTGAIWIVALLALAAAGIFLATAPAYRRRRGRSEMVELATIENHLSGRGAVLESDERDDLVRRRDALRERLTRRS